MISKILPVQLTMSYSDILV